LRQFASIAPIHPGAAELSTPQQLSDFLAQVERRAFKQAQFAVRDGHVALDIVQDAMLKLAERYGDRPTEEYPLLFQRILQNTIRDHYRRQKVRSFWTTLMSSLIPQRDGDELDPLESLQDEDNASQPARPDEALAQSRLIAAIEEALSKLPARQREAFLLRYWEGMDTTETAAVMGCSEGSVKTHCSRATHALAATLIKQGIDLT
jgi:RNA polymerase sigma-70 factor (ECF subfamily)